ncbi:hypothetical protein SAMN05421788_102241 [Filimonas lacunae]|uniref:Uncharacterized protein n=1 Tax=Filimonas lacunae TaxID=477680 RepID=A0A173MHN9_9BACT|nr:hypothetical protein [Filimonas lacunae]BAV07132.1 hypothetical protein FLA_3155 [Filimonas lacunae]SIS94579.1 hypothetical protein SAMN05421788_102241 [Filimonas lacunae]
MQDLMQQLSDTEQRLNAFLQKLDQRADELLEGYLAEAPAIIAGDDQYGQSMYRFTNATRGQIQTLRQKADDVRQKQIRPLYESYATSANFGTPVYSTVQDWFNRCTDTLNAWEDNLFNRMDTAIEKAEWKDYEVVFSNLMNNYHQQKENVHCKQCGAKLTIEGVYYYSTYIPCNFCNTQNIFDPGTSARELEHTARQLAEQRCKPMKDAHEQMNQHERDLYMQGHELHLSLIHEKDKNTINTVNNKIAALEAERQEAIRKAPELLEAYYRAMFDEMTKLLPDLSEHNDKFFLSIKESYLQKKYNPQ